MSYTTSRDAEIENSNIYIQFSLIWIHLKCIIKHGNTHSNERLNSIFNPYFDIPRGKILKNHFLFIYMVLKLKYPNYEYEKSYKSFEIIPRTS